MKLTDEDRAEIYRLYTSGEMHNVYALAKKYGVSRGTIYFIINPEAAEKNRVRTEARNEAKRQAKLNESKED